MQPMQRTQVSSDTVMSVGYEAATSILELELASQEIYQYFNVPLDKYIGLMKAVSKGTFYNHNIKSAYEYKKVREEVN